MITVEQFCDKHEACTEGHDWALAQGVTTMAELWKLDIRPDWRIWIATRPGVLDDRTLRLSAVYCARSVQHLMKDQRSINSIDVAERYAHGEATDEELGVALADGIDAAIAARTASGYAARDAERAAMGAAARDAARAARYAANSAARAARAAWYEVRDAARAAMGAAATRDAARAARYAGRDAARAAEAAWDRFINWLINTTPNFEGEQS